MTENPCVPGSSPGRATTTIPTNQSNIIGLKEPVLYDKLQ